ncbi:MAG: SDR family oxidoreductase [Hydrogenophaga sp.]|uniref:SDR family oxidoreductase n=1 Tax=Hydrogenophaga crocea TaxID=2716225 RepID=A0A6G8IHF4_9BURK|nr:MULTISPECIES: SDR family oxidoreductase [Hydrogenophaga]MBL0944499.1 SDR family oxidoreductase [Hydrogenophaga sp.]QIM52624.1 SDR family oxidoreductase [Hydrogenophaga crocea]
MQIQNATVLITGANRGIGLAFAREALARGARRVYAASRQPGAVTLPGVTPLPLDVTDPEQVARAVREAGDVTLLINNAGVAETGGFLADTTLDATRRQLEVNFFGMLRMSQAFAPVLAAHGGGALLNVLSIASWINRPLLGTYGATKSAAWALTNGLRHELRAQGTQVTALHMGFVDTALTHGIDAPKSTPEAIVARAFDGLEAGADEVLADALTQQVKASLSSATPAYLAAA